MLTNTYTVTKLHTSTTTQGVDALIEQLEQDKINARRSRSRYYDEMFKYHKNSIKYKNYNTWFLMECERFDNAKKYLNILKEGTNNAK